MHAYIYIVLAPHTMYTPHTTTHNHAPTAPHLLCPTMLTSQPLHTINGYFHKNEQEDLQGIDVTQHNTKSYQASSGAIHALDKIYHSDADAVPHTSVGAIKEGWDQEWPLEHEARDEEGEPNSTVRILAQEGHQETQTNEHHECYVDVVVVIGGDIVLGVGEVGAIRADGGCVVVSDYDSIDDDEGNLKDNEHNAEGVELEGPESLICLVRWC